jgi:nucleotide-binding universal stress UspA family protein
MKLLLPFDGSPAAVRALEYVAALEQRDALHVHLLNVQPRTVDDEVYLEPLLKGGEKMLRDAARYLEARAISHTSEVAVGSAADAIVARARADRFAAIVMGVRSAMARLFTGSVSRGVVRESGLPVMLVTSSGQARVAGAEGAGAFRYPERTARERLPEEKDNGPANHGFRHAD